MTDEEKTEEILQTNGSMTFCAKGCEYTRKVKELIAIGLAEGRKEVTYMKASEYDEYLNVYRTNKQLQTQIERMKRYKEEIINVIKSDNSDIEWVKAHNGVAKYIYVQTVIDIINDKWEMKE